ncbi:hypothetical protein [Bradyrhizobium sp.]|uniref:hypothetical protein n=1 Tax=Bradyrhizobium sp. TaxID=376 RepID=UPI003C792758
MTASVEDATNSSTRTRAWLELTSLISLHIFICCLSLVYVTKFYTYLQIVAFDKTHLYAAVLNVALFAVVSLLFAFSRFSFGYFLGFYFYTMILGYLWIVDFSKFAYDHTLASVSAFASALAFFGPALFITSPIRQRAILSARALDGLLYLILILAATIIATGALYNFRLVAITDIYNFRDQLQFPAWLRYAIGVTSNALLPFAFACFVARRNRWRAAAALLLLLLFYPITLTKLAIFAPFWLLFLVLLSKFLETRTTAVLSLLLPLLIGVILVLLVNFGAIPYALFISYFGTINFRMIALPSIALDIYTDFFSTHDLTHFCQIQVLKPLINCPYSDYLSIIMEKNYHLGNLNASLFATEGIASVGPLMAPLVAFICGLIIAVANRLSAGLPARFILLSAGLLPQILLNVPLATTLLSNGGAILFLLWYVTPRKMFEES